MLRKCGGFVFLGMQDNLTNDSFHENGNLCTATVTVKIVGDENFLLTMERTMRVA